MNNICWLVGTTLPDGKRAYWDYEGKFSPTNIGAILESPISARETFGEVQRANPSVKVELFEYKLISVMAESDLPTSPITE